MLIKSVFVRESETKMNPEFLPYIPGYEIIGSMPPPFGESGCFSIEVEGSSSAETKICEFSCTFSIRYDQRDGLSSPLDRTEETFVASIKATFVAAYEIQDAEFPDEETLEKMAQDHVLEHIWPYWQELHQNTLSRMGLPISQVPFLSQMKRPTE